MSEKEYTGVTVEELFVACGDLVKKGFGKKIVQIVDDDEGNGWHTLWNGFVTSKASIKELTENGGIMHDSIPLDEIVLLG